MLRSVVSKYDGFMTWSIQLYDMHCACLWQCGDGCHTHPQRVSVATLVNMVRSASVEVFTDMEDMSYKHVQERTSGTKDRRGAQGRRRVC